MKQAVAAGQYVDECPELGDVHHAALVGRPNVGAGRVEDQPDLALRLGHRSQIRRRDRHDADRTVVVDADVGTRVCLDRVDHLALGSDDLADLVHWDFEGDDLGGVVPHLGPGLDDGLGHHVEDVEASLASLVKCCGEHRCRDP